MEPEARQLPDRETMMELLKAVSDDAYLVEKFYPRLCDSLAGQRKNDMGIQLAYELAKYDFLEGFSNAQQVVLSLSMDDLQEKWIETISVNPESSQNESPLAKEKDTSSNELFSLLAKLKAANPDADNTQGNKGHAGTSASPASSPSTPPRPAQQPGGPLPDSGHNPSL